MLKEKIKIEGKIDHGMAPSYATAGSAGIDLRANISSPLTLKRFQRALIPTGLRIALPEAYEGQIRPRSGLAWKHGVTVLNGPGTIDADYRGEIQVILINLGEKDYVIEPGERIAQMVIAKICGAEMVLTDCELPSSQRDEGGFGHTGRN